MTVAGGEYGLEAVCLELRELSEARLGLDHEHFNLVLHDGPLRELLDRLVFFLWLGLPR